MKWNRTEFVALVRERQTRDARRINRQRQEDYAKNLQQHQAALNRWNTRTWPFLTELAFRVSGSGEQGMTREALALIWPKEGPYSRQLELSDLTYPEAPTEPKSVQIPDHPVIAILERSVDDTVSTATIESMGYHLRDLI